MQTVAATPPSERFLLLSARFSERGVDAVRTWVRDRAVKPDRPLDATIERFMSASLSDHVVVMTLYAYADIPVGEVYDTAFAIRDGLNPEGTPEPTRMTIDHVVWEFGVPTPSVGHGHKHVLAMRFDGELPPAISKLPCVDDLRSAPFHVSAGLCDRRDWRAIQRRDLVSVLREARAQLARTENDFSWSSWRDGAEALCEVDALIDQLEGGELPDRTQVRALFGPTGPIQEVSVSSGWGKDFIRMASRFDAAEARNYGARTAT